MADVKVAAILNEREVAITVPRASSYIGSQWAIVEDEPIVVADPVTNEVLGSVDQIVARVRVTRVEDRYSIAETFLPTPRYFFPVPPRTLLVHIGQRVREIKNPLPVCGDERA